MVVQAVHLLSPALEPDGGPLRYDAREKEDGEKGVRTFHV